MLAVQVTRPPPCTLPAHIEFCISQNAITIAIVITFKTLARAKLSYILELLGRSDQ
ncbi:MAG: hypothetical protein ACI9O0_000466 [Paracoccaceae bacterium]|jgi:hypothetical protein